MEWLFEGLGTFVVGLLVGGVGGATAGWTIGVRKTKQSQRARDNATQTQVGRDSAPKA